MEEFKMAKDLIQTVDATYLDTSSLLSPNFDRFLQEISVDSRLCIPGCVYRHLVKFSQEETARGSAAKEVIALCQLDSRLYITEDFETKPARFFLDLADGRSSGNPILIITQSADLAYSLNRKRIHGNKILVKRLDTEGQLANYDLRKLPPKMLALSERTEAAAILKKLI
jgi:rRNA-processing protein FCF1